MSYEAMAWARKQKTNSPVLKSVLLAIANYADEDGKAWPSQARIVEDTELSKRSVIKALHDLEGMGLIERTERRRADGSRSTDLVRLVFAQGASGAGGGAGDAPGGAPNAGGAVHDVQGDGAGDAPLTTFEPPLNYQNEQYPAGGVVVPLPRKAKSKVKAPPAYTGDYEIFWAEYPRQKNTSKAEAFAVFIRLSPEDQNAAIEGAIAYAEHCRKEQTPERFIAHATTFLNQRRWECAA